MDAAIWVVVVVTLVPNLLRAKIQDGEWNEWGRKEGVSGRGEGLQGWVRALVWWNAAPHVVWAGVCVVRLGRKWVGGELERKEA